MRTRIPAGPRIQRGIPPINVGQSRMACGEAGLPSSRRAAESLLKIQLRMNLKMLRLVFASLIGGGVAILSALSASARDGGRLAELLEQSCADCHGGEKPKGGLNLSATPLRLEDGRNRAMWIRIYDRVLSGEMPPESGDLSEGDRLEVVQFLRSAISSADTAEVSAEGRGGLRRLNRDEYQQNLRDVLELPHLDIRDMLPEDREGHHFNKTADLLDLSRVQLSAYLDAAEAALRAAVVEEPAPPASHKVRFVGTNLFPEKNTFGEREAMFFARDNKAVLFDRKTPAAELEASAVDETLELALFRSAHWPYYGYPRGFVAKQSGEYRVRFSARAVVQLPQHMLKEAAQPVPMTFRARKPSGPDVSGDVRATGGVMDIQPEASVFETVIRLRTHETFEYSLLGLPVPLARNVNGGPPTYRYPPLPEGGQPGVAFQWLEIEGPLAPESWPPGSHKVLLDELGINPAPSDAKAQAARLLRRFVRKAGREPLAEGDVARFERLMFLKLEDGATFSEAVFAGYKAFLCSPHFLYLREPNRADDDFAIASRLSHFLTNTRPDRVLMDLAAERRLHDRAMLRMQAERLIAGDGFERFVRAFTDYWLNLRHIQRDEPDIRLYPEYRFDDYLVESMENETRAFFALMVRENLSSRVLVDADFVLANDRLANHYRLPGMSGSLLRKVALPEGSPLGGLLTQASLMKVTSNGTTTSPVVRGAWIMDRIFGEPPPPPPASVPAIEPDIRGAKTIRELLELHTKSKACSGCHAKFEPVGMALESFDIFGGWRTQYRGIERGQMIRGIDRAGHDFAYTLAEPVNASARLVDGTPFRDVRELKKQLGARVRPLARNLLQQFVVYSTGTPVRFSERAEIEAMLDAAAADGFRVRDLLLALVQSSIFVGKAGDF